MYRINALEILFLVKDGLMLHKIMLCASQFCAKPRKRKVQRLSERSSDKAKFLIAKCRAPLYEGEDIV